MSKYGSKPTIYSVITGPGKSAVSIIRVSGQETFKCLHLLSPSASPLTLSRTQTLAKYNIKPRYTHFKTVYDVVEGQVKKIDEGLVVYHSAPHSFTGEDTCEFQIHGSTVSKKLLLQALGKIPDFRQAEPGEFTKRAMFNGKLDAMEAEGLNDLINSESENQHFQSLDQLGGKHSQVMQELREEIITVLAHAEAYIEFEEEEDDVQSDLMAHVGEKVQKIVDKMQGYLDDGNIGEIIREGVKIAIVGPPNAGKSSLINYLAKSDIAIVSDVPGTTRDAISVQLNVEGQMVTLTDTAGLRETEDPIEKEGIKRSRKHLEEANAIIYVYSLEDIQNNLNPPDIKDIPTSKPCILLLNKCDLSPSSSIPSFPNTTSITCSLLTSHNLPLITSALQTQVKSVLDSSYLQRDVLITRQRHRQGLQFALEHLNRFLSGKLPIDMAVEELRLAMYEVGRIVGHIDIEQVYDTLFHDFCIGK